MLSINKLIIKNMDTKEFNEKISINDGLSLLCYDFDNLTEEQVKDAFWNAIAKGKGHFLLERHFEKLTDEQKETCKKQINNL
jgi:hypothetical protein